MTDERQEEFRLAIHLPLKPPIGEGATPLDTPETRPDYYGGAENLYEVVKVLEAWLTPDEFRGWLKGTVIKYQARATKGQFKLDAAKCAWYARYLSEYLIRTQTSEPGESNG